MRLRALLIVSLLAGSAAALVAVGRKVGPQSDGGWLVATGQRVRPAGQALTFRGRPIDLVLSPDGRTVFAKDTRGLVIGDARKWTLAQELSFPRGGGSLHGVAVSPDSRRVWATNSDNLLCEARRGASGKWSWVRQIALAGPGGKGASFPCGLVVDGEQAWVCLSRNNTLAEVDLTTGKVLREIATGVAPYDVVALADGTLAVSDWGGRFPKPGEPSADSAGTQVLTDTRGVAASGTVTFVDPKTGRAVASVETGLHPSDLALSPDGALLASADANSDTVTLIDTARRSVRATLKLRPDPKLPLGTAPTGVAFTPDGRRLLVACGGGNAVAVVDVAARRIDGWVPTGWYPGAVATDGRALFVANVKGIGSRGAMGKDPGRGVYQYGGTLTRAAIPTGDTLAAATQRALADAQTGPALDTLAAARPDIAPVAIPARDGEPSRILHVVYVIKENRTYDQVLGDLKQGDGDPKLCLYPRRVTPNHHALAEEFVLLDNFYCNGTLSADGHSWATEGNVTDHLEKSFGGFTRSYTFGDDPLTYSGSGFLWDNALDHKRTVVNFGEMDYTDEKPDVSYADVLKDGRSAAPKLRYEHRIGVARLRGISDPEYAGWNMDIPDVLRADRFLKRLKTFEQENNLPDLTIIYLPNDHTTGLTADNPTPASYLADNDLALGRIVEGISRSRFWATTAIFVVEDDPQDGFDHVDGHRSVCLVISPYVRRGAVVHDFYNQTSVLHTMERILGLPPMNRMDAASPVMATCFTQMPDLRAYTTRPNRVPLAQLVPAKRALTPGLRRWSEASARLPLRKPDGADEDTLNRILWHAAMGPDARYPAHLAGAHSGRFESREADDRDD